MKKFLTDNAVAIFIALLTAIGAIAFLTQIIFIRLPELNEKVIELSISQENAIEKARNELSSKLTENAGQQEKRLSKVEGSVSALRVSLVDLMNKVGKTPNVNQLKELFATANSLSESKSKFFSQAQLANKNDDLPKGQPWRGWSNLGLDIPKKEVEEGTSDAKNIKALLTRSIATDSAHWKNINNRLIVKYADGSITYTPKPDLTTEELDKLVIELNEIQEINRKTWTKQEKAN